MNKRGMGFIPLMALFSFILVVGAISINVSSETLEVGEFNNKIIGKYGEVKSFRYFVDSSVESAVKTSLYELGRNGGIFSVCRVEDSYVLLNDCYKDINGEFISYLSKNLKRDLAYEYTFEVINKNPLKVKGVSKEFKEIRGDDILFKVDPSFVYSLDYDLGVYDGIIGILNKERSCLRSSSDVCGTNWNIEKDGSIIKVDIKGEDMVVFNGKYVIESVDIKFSYDLEKSLVGRKSLI